MCLVWPARCPKFAVKAVLRDVGELNQNYQTTLLSQQRNSRQAFNRWGVEKLTPKPRIGWQAAAPCGLFWYLIIRSGGISRSSREGIRLREQRSRWHCDDARREKEFPIIVPIAAMPEPEPTCIRSEPRSGWVQRDTLNASRYRHLPQSCDLGRIAGRAFG
jgi:hypothetical protein